MSPTLVTSNTDKAWMSKNLVCTGDNCPCEGEGCPNPLEALVVGEWIWSADGTN